MNNKIIYSIIGVVVVLAIAFGFMAMRNPANAPTDTTAKNNGTGGQKGSLKSLLASGSPQQCTFTNSTDSSSSSGTVYVANGKMRGDFTTQASGKTIASHMIIIDNTSYVWTDAMPQGIKMSFDEMQKPSTTGTQNTQAVDVNQQMDYSCNGWSGDANQFALPTDIKFSSISEIMGGVTIPPGTPNTNTGTKSNPDYSSAKEAQCRACDGAPEPQRTQCRTALQCN